MAKSCRLAVALTSLLLLLLTFHSIWRDQGESRSQLPVHGHRVAAPGLHLHPDAAALVSPVLAIDKHGDKQALLAFEADSGNVGNAALASWVAESEPCDGFGRSDEINGWAGVMCNADRVVYVRRSDSNLRGRVEAFAPLVALRGLYLGYNEALHGNVAALSGMGWLS
eukprot:COSAG06_NODE_397_length_16244_cov_230.792320_17_plen_168_part_00